MNDLRTPTEPVSVPKPQTAPSRILLDVEGVPINLRRRETWLQAAWRLYQDEVVFWGSIVGVGGFIGGICWGIYRLQQLYPEQCDRLAPIVGGGILGGGLLVLLVLFAQDINDARKEIDDG